MNRSLRPRGGPGTATSFANLGMADIAPQVRRSRDRGEGDDGKQQDDGGVPAGDLAGAAVLPQTQPRESADEFHHEHRGECRAFVRFNQLADYGWIDAGRIRRGHLADFFRGRATTYNPFFYVNSALVSRSQVFRLEPLKVEQLEVLIDRALADKERGLGNYNVKMDKNARRHLAKLSDGDARKCLNALEIGVLTTPPKGNNGAIHFTLQVAEESIQQKAVVYDRAGDAHYDTISAFIKSMRASDEKGAMYWLAKMLHAGEDFRFIARRIVIFASEDVGLADPEALQLAIATQQAVEFVGMPEARIPLAHATAYMCRAAKSREAYDELNAATEKVEMEQTKRVPENLKNKHFPVNPES